MTIEEEQLIRRISRLQAQLMKAVADLESIKIMIRSGRG